MLAVKQTALNTISKLLEDTDIDEIMYQLDVIDKIRKAQQAVELKQVFSSEDLKREIDLW